MSFIVEYSNSKYDVEQFLDSHPAGKKIILPYKDKDITDIFTKIGHSANAMKILNKYRIDRNNNIEVNNKYESNIIAKKRRPI
jgi:cytochrome b involved in lipid metabolism